MSILKPFIYRLGACIGLPTLCMVIAPYTAERNRQSAAYVAPDPGDPGKLADPEKHGEISLKGLSYPPAYTGDQKRGEEIYAREGCAQCHTQVIRPDYAGIDQFKKTWGADQEGKSLTTTRQTVMWDYLHEDYAMTGQRRLGPDLANVGYRFEKNLNDLYVHLYAPRVRREWSNSPSFRHLFIHRKRESETPYQEALVLPPNLAPEDGWEIVPSGQAKALAAYLIGLKRDFPVPVSISGPPPRTVKTDDSSK